MKYFFLTAFFCFCISVSARAQVSSARVFGHVPLADASDANNIGFGLQDIISGAMTEVDQPDSNGDFEFLEIPFGTYDLYLRDQNKSYFIRRVQIDASFPARLELDSVPALEMWRSTPIGEGSFSQSHTTLTAPVIAQLPVENTAYGIDALQLQSPGIIPSANDWMHLRGESPPPEYIIDGIPITNTMTRLTMPLFDASLVESADLLRGNVDARYGSNGILNINTKSGFDATTFGHAEYSIGTDGSGSQEVDLGGRADNAFAYYFSYGNFGSDRYLDPLTGTAPSHTTGSGSDYFGTVNILASDALTIDVLGYYSSSMFQIPNDNTATAQDRDNDMVATTFGARMEYDLSDESALDAIGYTRRQSQSYTSNGVSEATDSVGLWAASQSENYFIASRSEDFESGGELTYSARTDWFGARNNFELGAQGEIFPLQQYYTIGFVHGTLGDSAYNLANDGKPFIVDTSAVGKRVSAYAEDKIMFVDWTISGGLRYDLYELFDQQSGLSPRLGVSYRASDPLTVRASYNRIFQPAPMENVLISNSPEAAALMGTAQSNVQAEQSNNFELGAHYTANAYLAFDLSGYYKTVDNMLAEFDLDNSDILLPANIKNGKIYGAELELDLRNWNHFSGMLTVSSCTSLGMVPSDGSSPYSSGFITGGLAQSYAAEMLGNTTFHTDAGEPLSASFLLRYEAANGYYFFALSGRYDMGLPFGDFPTADGSGVDAAFSPTGPYQNLLTLNSNLSNQAVAFHATLNISAGYNFSHFGLPIMISGSVINIFNTTYLTEFDPVYGGAHYGTPREFLVMGELSP